ncbi:extracellular solute-binding protein, partial [Kibdelosporangium lantanae]
TAGCGGTETPAQQGGGHLTVWLMNGDLSDKAVAAINTAFEKATGAQVTVQVQEWDNINTKISTALAQDTTPDVIEIGNTDVPLFAANGALTDLTRRYPPQRDKAHAMALDSSLVTVTSDHALLYADPSVFSRLSFLTDSTHVRPLNSLPQPTANDDLRADLVDLIAQYTANGLDVIVVNQTTPEHQAGGFTCVKVLIPGTLSMTFGHTHRRTTGLPRLDAALAGSEVNPHPHPFP